MIWDMCGEEKARNDTWPDQCIMASALMFVFDAGNSESMAVARAELFKVLSHEELSPTAPLLVWANKMDVVGSVTETALSEFLSLNLRADCEHRQWCVQGSVMHDHARGLDHGLKWLYLALSQKPAPKKWKPLAPELVPNENLSETITAVTYEQAHRPLNTPRPAASTPPTTPSSPSNRKRPESAVMAAAIDEEDDEEEEDEQEEEEGGEIERLDLSPSTVAAAPPASPAPGADSPATAASKAGGIQSTGTSCEMDGKLNRWLSPYGKYTPQTPNTS